MKIKDYFLLTFESLTIHKFRAFLSILGITIGVAAVIGGVVLGVGNSEMIMQKLAESGADALAIYVKPKGGEMPSSEKIFYEPNVAATKADIQYIKKKCSALGDITPYIVLPVTLRHEGKYHIVKALGVMIPQAVGVFGVKVIGGRFFSDFDVESKSKVCVIEKTEFSDEIFGGKIPLGEAVLIGGEKYKVIGVTERMRFRFGSPGRLTMLFPSTTLQEATGFRDFTTIQLRVKKIKDISRARFQLNQALLQRFGSPSKLMVSEYGGFIQMALEVSSLLTVIIIGIAVISLTVGGIGIMNVMMTAVAERTREIGMAKAIGAKKNSIMLMFLTESIILSLLGGTLGILLGLGISKLVTLAIGVPFINQPWVIILGFFLSVAVGVVSGSYPAKRAAELEPVEALRQF